MAGTKHGGRRSTSAPPSSRALGTGGGASRRRQQSGLPRERTSFVGREADIATIRALVEGGAQLVTLVGPPGIGKTRTAIQAARALGGDVVFCELSEAHDAGALLLVVALALGVSVEAPMSEETLAKQIGSALDRQSELLVVLDNAEQVLLDAARFVTAWLDDAPSALFLVTSRERLRVPGERAIVLGPLSLPRVGATSPDELLAADGVRLLVERARLANTGLNPEPQAIVLAEIARRVEGSPLAIELCAARLGVLDATQLLARLRERLDVLSTDVRFALERQASLHGALDWSWELLDAEDRLLLAQCSVFRGGFDLDAAERVLQVGERPVLGALTSLYEKSLVAVTEIEGTPFVKRFRLYESIREYAEDKLLESRDGASQAAARHALYFAEAGARWARDAKGAAFVSGLGKLERESDNILAAQRWARTNGDPKRALELVLCLEPQAIVRGPILPYLALLETTLAEADHTLSPALAGRAFGSLGLVESRRARPKQAVAHFRRAIELASQAGASDGLPYLLSKLANQYCVLGEDADAGAAFERARALLDVCDDPAARGVWCRHHAFFCWRAGKVEEARREGERARMLLEQDGDRRELAYVLSDVAASYLDEGDLDAAIESLDAAIDLSRTLRYRRVEGRCQLLFALAHREQGRFDDAAIALERAREVAVEDGDRASEGFALWHMACLALERGDARTGRRLGERALVHYEEIGDDHLLAHAHMILGAAFAQLGKAEAAEAPLERADDLLASGPSHVREALALFRALVPLSRRRGADLGSATSLLREAERALADFDTRMPHPLASERFARRLLVRSLSVDPGERAASDRAPFASEPPGAPSEPALLVSPDGRRFRITGKRAVSLERRGALGRILAVLARERTMAPGAALSLDQVLKAGWPGEHVSVETGAARVYNAVQRLRKLGLESMLRTRDDGYLLDPDMSIALKERFETTDRL